LLTVFSSINQSRVGTQLSMNLAQTGGVVDRQRGAGVPTSVAQLGSAGQAIADEKKLARLAPGFAIIFAALSEKEWGRAILPKNVLLVRRQCSQRPDANKWLCGFPVAVKAGAGN
jgi:hypothetical protein